MLPEFVARTGGSKWLSALPTGSNRNRALHGGVGNACRANFGGGLGERKAERSLPQPRRQRRPAIRKEFADSKKSGTPIYGSRFRQ